MKQYLKHSIAFTLLLLAVLAIGSGCNPANPTSVQQDCEAGIEFKLDGTLIQFDNAQVTAEIFNDAAIGKFYDIWTDENVNGFNGFYFHSTVTETGEEADFAPDWFVTSDVANLIFLNDKENVNVHFKIIEGANAVGDHVEIDFQGSYIENGTTHQITDGKICTSIDVVH